MPRHENPNVEAEGEITHVFAHRFVVDTGSKPVLADLTPRGLEIVKLRVGDRVALKGEEKPSELKVSRLERNGVTFEIGHGPPHDRHEHGAVDLGVAVRAANHAGYRVIGEARRKRKHFEVLGKRAPNLRSFILNSTEIFARLSLCPRTIANGDPKSSGFARREAYLMNAETDRPRRSAE
jgi:hypothetical protein